MKIKVNFKEQINSNLIQYAEVVKSDKFIQVENFSLDFMVQNHANWEQFRNGIILFRETLLKRNTFIFNENALTIESIKYQGNLARWAHVSKATKAESANFFENQAWHQWMVNKIVEYLNDGVAVGVYPGVVLVGKNHPKVLLGKEFIGV